MTPASASHPSPALVTDWPHDLVPHACVRSGGPWLDLGRPGRHRRLGLAHPGTVRVAAPHGAGKSSRIVVPSLVRTRECSFVVHDPDGSLWEACSGWLAARGEAWRLDWSAPDPPGALVPLPGFNPLDHRVIPAGPGERDVYLRGVGALIARASARVHTRGTGDAFFVARAGDLIATFAACAIRTAERERADVAPARRAFSDAFSADATLWSVLEALEALRAGQLFLPELSAQMQYADLSMGFLRELEGLAAMAPREREVLAALACEALGWLGASPAARVRTSRTDLFPASLGGVLTRAFLARSGLESEPRTADGWDALPSASHDSRAWRPLYVFVGARSDPTGAGAALSALFLDVWARAACASGARGPLPAGFVLEDADRLGSLPWSLDAMDLGRSRKRFFLVTGPSLDALDGLHPSSRADAVPLLDTMRAVDVVLSCERPEERPRLGVSCDALAALGTYEQIVVCAGRRPVAVRAESAPWWARRRFESRTWNPRAVDGARVAGCPPAPSRPA